MKIACTIINYNDSSRVKNLTSVLLSYDFFNDIVIIDNASSEKEKQILSDIFSKKNVHVLELERNVGYNAGNNAGFKFLENRGCDYVFSINSDIEVHKDALVALVDFLEKNKDYAVCGCKMIEYGKEKASFYNFPTVHNEVMSDLGLRKIFKLKPKPNKVQDGYIDVDLIRSSLCCYRFKSIKRIDFYDPNTFLYFGEAIISKKLKDIGMKCAVLTNVYYNHNHIYSNRIMFSYNIGKKDRDYAFAHYFKTSKFGLIRMNLSYSIGWFLRRIVGKK